MLNQSPYNYAFNNPVYWIDPDGRMPEEGDAGGVGSGGVGSGGFELGGGGDPPTEFTPEELKDSETLDAVLIVVKKSDDNEKTQNDKKKKSNNQTQKKQKNSKNNGKPGLWDRFVDWLRRNEPKLEGAGLGYGQGSGSGIHVRKNGTPNMDPIDLSDGMPLGGPFRMNIYLRTSSTGRAVFAKSASLTHGTVDQTANLVELINGNANNEIPSITFDMEIPTGDITFNPCLHCPSNIGTLQYSLESTTINVKTKSDSIKIVQENNRIKASYEQRSQSMLDSIREVNK